MIRILYRHQSGTILTDMTADQVSAVLRDASSRLWIDMVGAAPDEQRQILEDVFHFHPLAVEDAIQDVHSPKADDYGEYLYVVLHKFVLGEEHMDIDTEELDIFLGPNYLVTIHRTPSTVIEELWNQEGDRAQGLARGPAFLLAHLLDRQVDTYSPLLDRFEEQIEDLGDRIFFTRDDSNVILDSLLTAKSSTLRLRRILLPQRDVLHRLSRTSFSAIPADARIYFLDVYDHVARLADLSDGMRDLTSSTIQTYLAIANNRMNEIVKVLTIISTIFIPLTFLAGVYGMNFLFMPELSMPWAYPLVWLIFVVIAATLLFLFRRRRWI